MLLFFGRVSLFIKNSIIRRLLQNEKLLQLAYNTKVSRFSKPKNEDSPKTLNERLKNKILMELQTNLPHFSKSLVEYQIDNIWVKIPVSHNLPIFLGTHPLYSRNLPRISKIVYSKYPKLSLIDVGANIGDSVALIRNEVHFPILAIEGEPSLFSVLEQNSIKFDDLYIVKKFLGDCNVTINASISIEQGTMAYIKDDPSCSDSINLQTLDDLLKDYPEFQDAKILKIDTDGFDLKILRGADNFLSEAKPVLFFEYSPFLLSQQQEDGLSIFPYLQSKGYKNLLIYDNLGYLMMQTTVDNLDLLSDLHNYFMSKKLQSYCDVCAFNDFDDSLFQSVKEAEHLFYKNLNSA